MNTLCQSDVRGTAAAWRIDVMAFFRNLLLPLVAATSAVLPRTAFTATTLEAWCAPPGFLVPLARPVFTASSDGGDARIMAMAPAVPPARVSGNFYTEGEDPSMARGVGAAVGRVPPSTKRSTGVSAGDEAPRWGAASSARTGDA